MSFAVDLSTVTPGIHGEYAAYEFVRVAACVISECRCTHWKVSCLISLST